MCWTVGVVAFDLLSVRVDDKTASLRIVEVVGCGKFWQEAKRVA